jgi:hypothetical protein
VTVTFQSHWAVAGSLPNPNLFKWLKMRNMGGLACPALQNS